MQYNKVKSFAGDGMNKLRNWLARVMYGRYGMDKLNSILLWISVIIVVLGLFMPFVLVRLMMTAISYGLMFWVIFRTFSRNTYRRYQENQRFLIFWRKVKDRQHRYYRCPRCRQSVRVPRGKGKIAITCPKCHEKFIKKT